MSILTVLQDRDGNWPAVDDDGEVMHVASPLWWRLGLEQIAMTYHLDAIDPAQPHRQGIRRRLAVTIYQRLHILPDQPDRIKRQHPSDRATRSCQWEHQGRHAAPVGIPVTEPIECSLWPAKVWNFS